MHFDIYSYCHFSYKYLTDIIKYLPRNIRRMQLSIYADDHDFFEKKNNPAEDIVKLIKGTITLSPDITWASV